MIRINEIMFTCVISSLLFDVNIYAQRKAFFSKKGTYILLQIHFFSLQHLPRDTKILKILIVWSRVNPHSKSCLNIKELLAQNRRNTWSLSDCNGTRTHNHLVCERTLYYLVKLTNGLLNGWVFVYKEGRCGFESHSTH